MTKFFLCLTVVSVACLLALSSANADLVAYWSFDTDVTANYGGSAYDGTIIGDASVSSVESKWGGGSAKFTDATNNAAIEMDIAPGGTEDWSMSSWYWLDLDYGEGGFNGTWISSRIDRSSIGKNDYMSLWYVHNDNHTVTYGSLITPDDGSTLNWATEIVPLAGESTMHREWVNVVTVTDHDPIANITTSKNYVNGVQVGASAGVSPAGGPIQYATNLPVEFIIGNSPNRDQEWKGYVDDVAVYDHLLSAAEIDALQTGPADSSKAPVRTEVAWRDDVGGDWHIAGNWSPSTVPNATTITAIFGDVIQQGRTVFTDTDVTVKGMQFLNMNTYAISGTGSIHLNSGTTAPQATIEVYLGDHQLQATVNLEVDTDVMIAGNSSLAFNNTLNLGGHTLTKTGEGTLAIRNTLTTGGGTLNVQQGIVSGNGAIGGDVNNNGGTISPGDSSAVGGIQAVVPEPGAMLLLLIGMLCLVLRPSSERARANH